MPRPNTGPKLYWHPERGTYYIRWYERGEKRVRSTGTSDRHEAEKCLAQFIGASHKPASGPRQPDAITVGEALDLYGTGPGAKAADPTRIGYAITALLPFWQDKTIAEINAASCDQYARHRDKAPGTVRRELGTLAAAINHIHREGVLTRAVPVTLPPKPAPKERWLTVSEAAKLLNAARTSTGRGRGYLPLFILIGLYTGARKEAILSLRWPQVDLARGRINFARPGIGQTKKRRPMLPMPARLRTFLHYAWQRRSSDTGTVLHIDGRPIQKLNRGFALAAGKAGLSDVTPHTLRHTRGTWLAQQGVPIWQIAGWLGQDPETTSQIYAHHHPDFMGEAMAAVDRRKAGNGNQYRNAL
jgi:hypothetical protein